MFDVRLDENSRVQSQSPQRTTIDGIPLDSQPENNSQNDEVNPNIRDNSRNSAQNYMV